MMVLVECLMNDTLDVRENVVFWQLSSYLTVLLPV